MDLIPLIKEIGRGASGSRSLSSAEAEQLLNAMLDDAVPPLQLGAILIALRMKGESLDEMEGFLRAASRRRHCSVAPGSAGPRPVVIPSYNGARRGANLTPLLAILLSAIGLPVLVHGPQHVSGRVGTLEILSAFGCYPVGDSEIPADAWTAGKPLVFHTSTLFPELERLMSLRAVLGLRNAAHSLVKMIDPFAGRGIVLSAATHPPYLDLAVQLFSRIGGSGLVFRATEGEPYFNPKRSPTVQAVRCGAMETLIIGETGSLDALPELPADGSLASTVLWMQEVLAGRQQIPLPILDQIACCWLLAHEAAGLEDARKTVLGRLQTIGVKSC